MLRIRLSRIGKNNAPHYSVVVTEKSNAAKDGNFLERLGYFNPRGKKPAFEVKKERVQYWIGVGAQPTFTMARLLHKAGITGMERFVDFKKKFQKKSKKEGGEVLQSGATPAPAEAPVQSS